MSNDDTDRTSPISEVNSRLIPAQRVRQAKSIDIATRISQARRQFASLAAAAADPPIHHRVQFVISDLGTLKTTTLARFQLTDENDRERLGFTLAYEYRGREKLKHVCESELVHNKLRKTLIGLGLNFRAVSAATVNRLEIDAAVPAFVSLHGVAGGKQIALTLSNVSLLGSTTYELNVDAVDRKFVEALIELISSGDRGFYQLVARSGARRD